MWRLLVKVKTEALKSDRNQRPTARSHCYQTPLRLDELLILWLRADNEFMCYVLHCPQPDHVACTHSLKFLGWLAERAPGCIASICDGLGHPMPIFDLLEPCITTSLLCTLSHDSWTCEQVLADNLLPLRFLQDASQLELPKSSFWKFSTEVIASSQE